MGHGSRPRLGGGDGRRAEDPDADLALEGFHGAVGASAHALAVRVGGGDGVPDRQPLRPGPVGARAAEPGREAHEGDPAPGGRFGDREGTDDGRNAGCPAGLRALVLTAARWGEVRWAEWSEIDLRESVWTVPATRMKAKREHRVPLCGRAVEILAEARKLGGEDTRLVFTRSNGKAPHRTAVAAVDPQAPDCGGAARVPVELPGLGRRGNGPPPGGCRGSAGACGSEQGGSRVPAHDLFERRRRLMDDWAGLSGGAGSERRDLPQPGLRSRFGPIRRLFGLLYGPQDGLGWTISGLRGVRVGQKTGCAPDDWDDHIRSTWIKNGIQRDEEDVSSRHLGAPRHQLFPSVRRRSGPDADDPGGRRQVPGALARRHHLRHRQRGTRRPEGPRRP
ncbi:MAG: tyrosine-type recombinase/integrase [Gemmatimonadales bacterium]|nr:tyrosine-type recombinase/integrase [Candidatus Palauibacter irciniicola]